MVNCAVILLPEASVAVSVHVPGVANAAAPEVMVKSPVGFVVMAANVLDGVVGNQLSVTALDAAKPLPVILIVVPFPDGAVFVPDALPRPMLMDRAGVTDTDVVARFDFALLLSYALIVIGPLATAVGIVTTAVNVPAVDDVTGFGSVVSTVLPVP